MRGRTEQGPGLARTLEWVGLDAALARCARGEIQDLKTELGLRRLREAPPCPHLKVIMFSGRATGAPSGSTYAWSAPGGTPSSGGRYDGCQRQNKKNPFHKKTPLNVPVRVVPLLGFSSRARRPLPHCPRVTRGL